MVNVKAEYGWSDKSFTSLLKVVQGMLLEENTLPKSYYEAKKILCPTGMEYLKIHGYPNDCILYRVKFEEMHKCPRCRVSRCKMKDDNECSSDASTKKDPPTKVLWYFPIILRFKCLFTNGDDAKDLTRHADGRKCNVILYHPIDSSQWKKINRLYLGFGKEARNLRLRLTTDGMNPFGDLSIKHNLWPTLIVIYNLPPCLCIK